MVPLRPRIPTALLDTNVLWPVALVNLLLSTAEDEFYELVTSDHLIEEIRRVLVTDKQLPQHNADTFCEQVRGVADRHICRAQYEGSRGRLSGPDDDDLWHLAAAIESGADYLVTNNVKDFASAMAPPGVMCPKIVTPDEFVMLFIEEGLADDLAATVERMTARLSRPPMTTDEMLARLRRDGLDNSAAALTAVMQLPSVHPDG